MRVLFVGLGAMGAPMSRNLAAAGHDLVLCDLRAEHAEGLAAEYGATSVPLPRVDDAAGVVDAVILMLPDSPAVEAVLTGDGVRAGLFAGLAPGSLVIDMSSATPTSTVGLAERAAERDLTMLDAPVSGGVARAETGDLSIMVGGTTGAVERAGPLLAALGSVTHVGPAGAGHAMKALNNLLSAIGLVAASEVLAIGTRFGLRPQVMLDVLNSSTGGNHATRVKMAQFVLSRSFDTGFSLQLMVKDLRTALDLAQETGTPTPVAAACLQEWTAARRTLPGDADHTHIAAYVEARSGVEFHAPATDPPTDAPSPDPGGQQMTDHETPQDERQEYIDAMARSRGYVLNYHKIMAKHDYETLKAANQLVHAAYLKERTLDRRTKELIFITSLTVIRAPKSHIQSHIRVALELGVSPTEILEAIEIALPEAGVVAFQCGFDAWAEVVGADGIEPRVETFNASASSE